MTILVDSREQAPWGFFGYKDVVTEKTTLQTGDYSLAGFEKEIVIERKSLPDLIDCLGRSRDRFVRELDRARAYPSFAVIVEASWQQIAGGGYEHSNLNPVAACASIHAFVSRWNIPFLFVGNRINGEAFAHGYFLQFLRAKQRDLETALKQAGAVQVPRRQRRADNQSGAEPGRICHASAF